MVSQITTMQTNTWAKQSLQSEPNQDHADKATPSLQTTSRENNSRYSVSLSKFGMTRERLHGKQKHDHTDEHLQPGLRFFQRIPGYDVARSRAAVDIIRTVKWQRRGGYAEATVVQFGPESLLP